MKKILEYRVFDILKDLENEKFLDKVKKENPDLYTRFLNLVGNKGLQKAKEIYLPYDPEEVKRREKEEKKETALKKKLGREEYKRQKNQEIFDSLKQEIEEVEKVLLMSELRTLGNRIMNDPILGNFLAGTKKRYINLFKKELKTPKKLNWKLSHTLSIDQLYFYLPAWFDLPETKLIEITQQYDLRSKQLTYSVRFSFYTEDDFYSIKPLKADAKKEPEYLESRNKYLRKLSSEKISKEELNNVLNKLKITVDEDIYLKWKEEYNLRKDMDKYNL